MARFGNSSEPWTVNDLPLPEQSTDELEEERRKAAEMMRTTKAQADPTAAGSGYATFIASIDQPLEQLMGPVDAEGSGRVPHGQGVTVTQGSGDLQERLLQEWMLSGCPLRVLAHAAQSQAPPNAASRYLANLPNEEIADQLMGLVNAVNSRRAAHGHGVMIIPLSQPPPVLSDMHTTSLTSTSAALRGPSASSSVTTGAGSSPGAAMVALRGERQAAGQQHLELKYSFKKWARRTFVIINNTLFKVEVHVRYIPLIKKLSSLGVSGGSNSVAINAAFEHLRAAERTSWTVLEPGKMAEYVLDGGSVSVLSQEKPTMGFCEEYLMEAGWKLIVSGTPYLIRGRVQPMAQPVAGSSAA